jgi:hypothetical protein
MLSTISNQEDRFETGVTSPPASIRGAPGLDRIQAAVLAINSADDERNPPENGKSRSVNSSA